MKAYVKWLTGIPGSGKKTLAIELKKYLPKGIRERIRERIKPVKKISCYCYKGNKFECPFCGFHFRKGRPYGSTNKIWKEKKIVPGGYRPNARCPRCDSLDRLRHIFLYLKNKTRVLTDELRILHVAPEVYLTEVLRTNKKLDYVSMDLDPKKAMNQMDLTNIKFDDNSFDVIICSQVLEHIPDDKKALCELYRVLKTGGFAILQVPISEVLEKTFEDPQVTTSEMRLKIFGQADHVRIYGQDYYERLQSVGFEIEFYRYADEKKHNDAQKYALIENEKLVIVKKKYQSSRT